MVFFNKNTIFYIKKIVMKKCWQHRLVTELYYNRVNLKKDENFHCAIITINFIDIWVDIKLINKIKIINWLLSNKRV